MKRATFFLLPLILAGMAGGALEEISFATRLRCDVNTPCGSSLDRLTFQQGTTPLIDVQVLRGGRPIATDTTVTARLVFGASATAAVYSVSTNYAVTNNSYLVQVSTVGTNSAAATNGLWWYTLYFDRAGKTFWTGNGELVIEKTTSTADGTVWQPITTSQAVSDHNTNGAAHADIRALIPTLPTAYTDTTARAMASSGIVAAAGASNLAATAHGNATNALTLAQWLQAQGYVTPPGVSNIIAGVSPTQRVYYADRAGYLESGTKRILVEVTDVALLIHEITNTTRVIVTALDGTGPAVGTVFTTPIIMDNHWDWQDGTGGDFHLTRTDEYPLYDAGFWKIKNEVTLDEWNSANEQELPTEVLGQLGTITIDWAPGTNTTTIPISSLTNAISTGSGSVALNGLTLEVAFPDTSTYLEAQTNAEYILGIDSLDWTDTGILTGAVSTVTLVSTGYVWRAGYSQWTNAAQSRVWAASLRPAPYAGARLAGIRTLWLAYNEADTCALAAYYPGQTNAAIALELTAGASDTLETDVWTTNAAAASSLSWRATLSVTAETDDGSWTALPRVEVIWSK